MGLVDDSGHGGEKTEESGVLSWLVRGRHQRRQYPPYAGQHWIAGDGALVGPPYCGAEHPRDGPLSPRATEGVDQQRVRPTTPVNGVRSPTTRPNGSPSTRNALSTSPEPARSWPSSVARVESASNVSFATISDSVVSSRSACRPSAPWLVTVASMTASAGGRCTKRSIT